MAVTTTQSTARPKFKFLMVSNEPKTAKQRELQVTAIRTHAARISYRKKSVPPSCKRIARFHELDTPSASTASSNASAEESDTDSDDSSALSLRTRLGGGRVDPFNADVVPGLPTWILDLVDNAWTNAWCSLRSGRHTGLIHPDVFGWRRAGLSCPSLVHAHISGAIGIALAQGAWADQRPQLHRKQLYHATLAINYVRQELSRSNRPPPDELMLSIMTLSGHGEVVDDDEYRAHNQRPSPLARANRLDIFAKLNITDAHAQAIGTLVEKKGGLDNISLPGFRNLLCLTDVLQASIKGMQPRLPFVGETESLISSGKHVLDAKALELNTILGTGFERAGVVEISIELYTALLAVCELTAAMDHLQRDENNPPTLIDIVDYRIYVQHRIVSLAPASPMGSLRDDDCTYEACRIAALIYSDLNVWPLPSSTKTRPRLAEQLRNSLERHMTSSPDDGLCGDLLLWIAMMGAIASNNTKHQDYFITQLAHDSRALSWKNFTSIMRHYLWCDFIVCPSAMPLWYQACILRSTMGVVDSDEL